MQEEEAHQEEAPPEDPKEESTDTEMADDEGHDDPGPSDLREEANAEVPPPLKDAGPTPLVPGGDVVSPEEDALLMQPASQPEGPVTGSHSPRSEAGTVSGEMAGFSITSPSQPELAEDETPP